MAARRLPTGQRRKVYAPIEPRPAGGASELEAAQLVMQRCRSSIPAVAQYRANMLTAWRESGLSWTECLYRLGEAGSVL